MSKVSGGVVYGLLHLTDADYLRKLVALLRSRGFPVGEAAEYAGGFGGYTETNRLIVGGNGGGFGGKPAEGERYRGTLAGGFGGAEVGYVLVKASWLRVYVLAGFGGEGIAYGAQAHAPEDDSIAVAGGAPAARVGLGIELRLPLSRFFCPLIGLRVGYQTALMPYQWSRPADIDVPQPPRGGFFVRLVMGVGAQR